MGEFPEYSIGPFIFWIVNVEEDKMTGDYCPEMLGDLLPIYYRRLFPYESYCRWLGAGNVDKSYLARREFSFTLEGDIYLR